MKHKQKNTFLFLFIVLLALVVFAENYTTNTETEFNTGTYTNTTYNSDGYIELGARHIGDSLQPDGLVGSWQLDGLTGNVIDSYGSNDGTNSGTTRGVAGKINNSFNFIADADSVSLTANTPFYTSSQTDEITFSAWINIKDITIDPNAEDTLWSTRNLILRFQATNDLETFFYNDAGTAKSLNSLNIWDDYEGEWMHIAYTFDNTDVRIYQNGIQVATTGAYVGQGVGQIPYGTGCLGSNINCGTEGFNGSIDEVAIWNVSLTPTEILEIYNAQVIEHPTTGTYQSETFINDSSTWNNITITRGYGHALDPSETNIVNEIDYTGLIGYYNMDYGNGTDSSGLGKHLTSVSFDGDENIIGKINNATNFDGTNDHLADTNNLYDEGGESGTIALWIDYDPGTAYKTMFSYGDTASSDIFFSFGFTNSNILRGDLRTSPGTDAIIDTNNAITTGWHHLVWVSNSTAYKLYVDGKEPTTSTAGTGNQGAWFADIPNAEKTCINALCRSTVASFTGDPIDEVAIFNRSLSTTEIENLYIRGATRLNLTYELDSDGTEIPCMNYEDTFCSIDTMADNLTYYAYFETDDANYSAQLYNVTVDYSTATPPVVSGTKNVSLLGIHADIDAFDFATSTYTEVSKVSFNTSEAQTGLIVMSTFNVVKTTGAGESVIDVKIEVDGNIIKEETVRSVLTKNDEGSTGIIANFTVAPGEHNISAFFKRSGNGNINVNDIDWNLGQLRTNAKTNVKGSINDLSLSFSSTTEQRVFNFTVNKTDEANSSSYYMADLKLTSTGATRIFCRIDDSAYLVRDLTATGVGSGSIGFIEETKKGTHMDSLKCRNSNAETVNVTGTMLQFNLGDTINNTIQGKEASNSSTNSTNTITLTAGTYLLTQIEHKMVNDSDVLTTSSVSFQSDTGLQTPTIWVNSTGGDCYSKKERTFTSSGSVGNAKIFKMCDGLSVGSTYNFSLYITVPVGEQVTVYDESLQMFETEHFDTTILNTAPIINLLTPENGSTVATPVEVNWSVTDFQNSSLNLTFYINDVLSVTNMNENNNTLTTAMLADGEYNFTIAACETDTADLFCTNDTHTVIVANTPYNITNYGVGMEWIWLNATGATGCQISTDNITFVDINNNIIYNGVFASSLCTVELLDADTEYYFRAKSPTTGWGYLNITTKIGGESILNNIGGEMNMIAIVLCLVMLIVGFAVIGFVSTGFGVKFFGFAYAVIEAIFTFGILYVNEAGGSITNLLRINFYILAFVGFGIAMISLYFHSVKIAIPVQDNEDEDKWNETKWD